MISVGSGSKMFWALKVTILGQSFLTFRAIFCLFLHANGQCPVTASPLAAKLLTVEVPCLTELHAEQSSMPPPSGLLSSSEHGQFLLVDLFIIACPHFWSPLLSTQLTLKTF